MTYPEITVEDEVTQALAQPSQFQQGSLPLKRDTLTNLSPGFIVSDRNYISGRWPGDLYNFSLAFVRKLN